MSLDITYYKKINNAYNGTVTLTKKESEIYTLKQHIIKTFNNSLDFHDDVLRNNISQRFVISKYKDNDKKKITAFPNEDLNLGDIIDCFNTKWIVIDLNLDKTIYTKGIMQQCNYQLKWQNSSGDIIQRWIITENSSDIGVKESSVVQIGIDELKLIIPYDTDTVQLRNDKRLFIDNYSVSPTPYKIISVNNTEYVKDGHGYIEIIVKETQKNLNTDRPDLMLCDYISPTTLDTNETTDSSVISGSSILKIGYAKTYSVVFKDANNNVLTDVVFTWNVLSDFDTSITKTIDGQSITLKVTDSNLIGKNITLQVLVDNVINSELLITIASLF